MKLMKPLLQIISLIGLLLVLLPAILTFAGRMDFEQTKTWMVIGTVVWFASAIFWLGKKKEAEET